MQFVPPLLSLLPIVLAQTPTLETLPTGEYYYESTGAGRPQHVLLRKVGRTTIGVDLQAIGDPVCFRGWLDGNMIVNATWMLPPYQPDARLMHEDGVLLDLSAYRPAIDSPSAADQDALRSCMQFFWR
ncbi:hypothetical protein H6F67_07550 [Microcoleus sp. FACHB-1515]|uniref:hypothetical protein n=1 Tax=Cyanophyceae TaxID=3028117 RepID=UPI001682E655|nr:hypothetical protein [Microcoleus sp. FACHB-1515]MBD2089706.1 hypothetical protein [Microcoleus sp. FACHB-1515]